MYLAAVFAYHESKFKQGAVSAAFSAVVTLLSSLSPSSSVFDDVNLDGCNISVSSPSVHAM
jgi:hypothetical protein